MSRLIGTRQTGGKATLVAHGARRVIPRRQATLLFLIYLAVLAVVVIARAAG